MRAITDETQVATTNLENINRKLELMRREEERITRLRLEKENREYEDQRAERMRRAYDVQVQRLEEQIREIRERD